MTGLMARVAEYSKSAGVSLKSAYRSMGIMESGAQALTALAEAKIIMPTYQLFKKGLLSVEDIQFRRNDLIQANDDAISILNMRTPFVPEIGGPLLCRAEDQAALEQRTLLNVADLDRKDIKEILRGLKEIRFDFSSLQDVPGGIKISRQITVSSRAKVEIMASGSVKGSFEDARAVGITVAYNGQIIYSAPAIVRGQSSGPR